ADMDPGPLHGGPETDEDVGVHRQRSTEPERTLRGFRRQVRQRQLRGPTLLAPQARPEGGGCQALDGGGVGDGRQFMAPTKAAALLSELRLDRGCLLVTDHGCRLAMEQA